MPSVDWKEVALQNEIQLNEISDIWLKMGLDCEERKLQTVALQDEIQSLIVSKLTKERAMLEEYQNLSSKLETEVTVMVEILDHKKLETPIDCYSNILLKLAWLKESHAKLSTIVEDRNDCVQKIKNSISQFATRLGEVKNCSTEKAMVKTLSKQRIQELSNTLANLKQLLDNRLNEIQELVDELDYKKLKTTDIEALKFVECPEENLISLEVSNIQAIKNRIEFFRMEKSNRTQILRELGSKIQPLWDLLDISAKEKQTFFESNTGLSANVIQTCRDELDSLLKKKKEKQKDIIQKFRQQIITLEKRLGLAENADCEVKKLLQDKSFSDLAFDAHQTYLGRLEEQDKVLEPISGKYSKYLELCVIRDEYDEIIKDSTRLLDRRRGISKLREEERQRKIVEKTLPIFVKKLLAEGAKYESQYQCSLPCLQDVRKREDSYKSEKEAEKARKKFERISVTPKSIKSMRLKVTSQKKKRIARRAGNDENMNLINQFN